MVVTGLFFQRHVVAVQSSVCPPVSLSPCLCLPFSLSPPVHVGYVQCVGVVVCGGVWLWWWWCVVVVVVVRTWVVNGKFLSIKNMKPLWKVKSFEKQTSWKVSVLNCVFHGNMSKKSDADMYIYIKMYTVILRVCVTHHNHTTTHTQRHTPQTAPQTHSHTTSSNASFLPLQQGIPRHDPIIQVHRSRFLT